MRETAVGHDSGHSWVTTGAGFAKVKCRRFNALAVLRSSLGSFYSAIELRPLGPAAIIFQESEICNGARRARGHARGRAMRHGAGMKAAAGSHIQGFRYSDSRGKRNARAVFEFWRPRHKIYLRTRVHVDQIDQAGSSRIGQGEATCKRLSYGLYCWQRCC